MRALATFGVLFSVGCAAASEAETAVATDAVSTARTFVVRAGGSKTAAGEARADVSLGFRDSSFDGDEKAFCYVGRVADVCGLVHAYAFQMGADYGGGAHDTIAIQSCAANGDEVDVRYRLTDDYGGDVSKAKTIGPCSMGTGTNVFAASVVARPSGVEVNASVGFYDSSFDLPKKAFCYTGQPQSVCAAVEQYARGMHAQYLQGAHDDMTFESCTVSEEDVVTAKYHLTDDWGGDERVTRTIERCYDAAR